MVGSLNAKHVGGNRLLLVEVFLHGALVITDVGIRLGDAHRDQAWRLRQLLAGNESVRSRETRVALPSVSQHSLHGFAFRFVVGSIGFECWWYVEVGEKERLLRDKRAPVRRWA